MSIVSTGVQTLKTLVEVGDPSLPRDLREAFGFLTTDETIASDMKASDDELIVDLAQRMGSVEKQLRGLSELARTREKLAELALTTAAQADSHAASTADQLARVQWAIQEQVASGIRDQLLRIFGDKYETPPEREHVRRAVEETVEAAREATTLDEERLLVDALIGSLTPAGMKDAIGARLRKLVTTRQLGPAEISLLRKCHTKPSATLTVEMRKAEDLAESFALASVVPALVTIEVQAHASSECGYVTRIDQIEYPAKHLILRATDRGAGMVALLDEAKRVADQSAGSSAVGG